MTIKTKYNVGDFVYYLYDSYVIKSPIKTIKTESITNIKSNIYYKVEDSEGEFVMVLETDCYESIKDLAEDLENHLSK